MKNIIVGVIVLSSLGSFTPQVKAVEIRAIDKTNSTDRYVLVEEIVIEASTGNKEITIDRAETNIPKRDLQNNREYKPIDCFRNLNKPRRN
jgi:hypothetical protein